MYEIEILTGLRLSGWIGLASTTVLLYDHAINLTDEVEHFWSGAWTFSRVMYFCIRYLGFMQAVVSILIVSIGMYRAPSTDFTPSPSLGAVLFCGLAIVAMTLCQAAIMIRVWFLFAHSPFIKSIAVNAYIVCTLATLVLSGVLWPDLRVEITGTEPGPRISIIAWLFVPSLFFHSLSFGLKIYRFVTSPKYLRRDTFLWRFLKEGMAMYACALGSLLFIIIGVTMTDPSHIPLYETALHGGTTLVTLTIVSVCRAMLSIKSLAATLHVDPRWLLNYAELSRVQWRPGEKEGEIVVETFELPVASCPPMDAKSTLSLKGPSGSSGTAV